MMETRLFGRCFCLLAFVLPVRPGLGRGLDPARCLVSGNYNLIRLSESTDETSCRQDCVAEPGCHVAVVSTPLSGSAECLLVDCLNRSRLSRPRDPSASIAVYPKSSDEVLRCRDFEDRGSFSSCRTGVPRFFYNRTSYSCERFFSGCGSNGNSFHSREGCEALCSEKYLCYRPVDYGQRPPSPSQDPPSQDPPSQDPPTVFFYNVSSSRCEGFHFRGGASNGNMFSSVEQCEGLCGGVGVTTSPPAVASVYNS
ncbi:protein AMBP-like [Clinocottus analis]|uniref:protein AMBP-like n=1 Tax=Clinocottus analis TaxID=304258 RepID=UPI0035C1CBF7